MSSSHGGGRLTFRRNRPRIQQKSDNLSYVPDPVQLSSHHSQNVANLKPHFTTLNTNSRTNSRRRTKNAWGKNNSPQPSTKQMIQSKKPQSAEYPSALNIPLINRQIQSPKLQSNDIRIIQNMNHRNISHKNGIAQKSEHISTVTTSNNSSWLRFATEADDAPEEDTHDATDDTHALKQNKKMNEPHFESYYQQDRNQTKEITDVHTHTHIADVAKKNSEEFVDDVVRTNEFQSTKNEMFSNLPEVQGYFHKNTEGEGRLISNDFRNYDQPQVREHYRYARPRLEIDPNSFNRHGYKEHTRIDRNRNHRRWDIKIRERENSAWFSIKRFVSDIPQMQNFTPEFKPYRRISYKKYAAMIEARSREADEQLRQFHQSRINYTRKHANDWMTHFYQKQNPAIDIPAPAPMPQQLKKQQLSTFSAASAASTANIINADLNTNNSIVTATAPVIPLHSTTIVTNNNVINNNNINIGTVPLNMNNNLLLQQQQLQENIRIQEKRMQKEWKREKRPSSDLRSQSQPTSLASSAAMPAYTTRSSQTKTTAVAPTKMQLSQIATVEEDDQRQPSASASSMNRMQKTNSDTNTNGLLDIATTSVVPNFIKQQWAMSNRQTRQTSTSPYSTLNPSQMTVSTLNAQLNLENTGNSPYMNQQQNVALLQMKMRQVQAQQLMAKRTHATVFNQQLFEQRRQQIHQQTLLQQQKMYNFTQPQNSTLPAVSNVGVWNNNQTLGSGVNESGLQGISVGNTLKSGMQQRSGNAWRVGNGSGQTWTQSSQTPQPGSGTFNEPIVYAQDMLLGNTWQRSSFPNSNQNSVQQQSQYFGGSGSGNVNSNWNVNEQWNQNQYQY